MTASAGEQSRGCVSQAFSLVSVKGILLQCALILFAAKFLFAWLMTAHITSVVAANSTLLNSAAGDSRLLSEGAVVLSVLLENGWQSLLNQSAWLLSMSFAAWTLGQFCTALCFCAVAQGKSPVSRSVVTEATAAFSPFLGIAFAVLAAWVGLGGAFVLFVPGLGTVLERAIGDQATDIGELALLGMLVSGGLFLRLIADLTRARVALRADNVRKALGAALRTLTRAPFAVAAHGALRLAAAIVMQAVALRYHLSWAMKAHATPSHLAIALAGELLATFALFLYVDWIRIAVSFTHRTVGVPNNKAEGTRPQRCAVGRSSKDD